MSDESFDAGYDDFSTDGYRTSNRGPFADKVREVIESIDVSDSLTTPLKRAIDELLEVAAKTVGSEEASVLIRDGSEGGLKFLTAISDVKKLQAHIRLAGIAGLVFSSDDRWRFRCRPGSFWSGADERHSRPSHPQRRPLRSGNEIVGIEFVNQGRTSYPPSPEEMDHAAFFAEDLARLVDATEIAELVESIFDRSLKTVISGQEGRKESAQELREWINSIVAAPEHRDMGMLWISLREIFGKGDAERELCRDLLETLARFSQKRSAVNTGYLGF
jgi:hypothetical protein